MTHSPLNADTCVPRHPFKHAVVLGGSLAGLLAARVLADHFETVTLIERDCYADTTEARRGIPQANHVHGLLLRGRQILEQLFPGLQDEMIAAGAPLIDMANDVAWLTPAGWGVRFPSKLNVLTFTRPMLDLHLRKRLEQDSRVTILENTKVVALARDPKKDRLTGVVIANQNSHSDRVVGRTLDADLVVDTTGRGSAAPKWLSEIGYCKPEELVVDGHLGYASRLFTIPDQHSADWVCAIVQRAPPDRKRGGIIFCVEGKRWLVTLIGSGRESPPADENGFLEFARSLPTPIIYDAIKEARPVSAIKTHQATQNRLRHYERADRLPENFMLLGDAVCAFNPVYGQGMTVAAMGVIELDKTLRRLRKANINGLSRRFQKQLAKLNKAPWMMATSEDFRYQETNGGCPGFKTRLMHKYIDRVMQLSTQKPDVRNTLLQVFSMLLPPTALFRPQILVQVLGLLRSGKEGPIREESRRLPKSLNGNHSQPGTTTMRHPHQTVKVSRRKLNSRSAPSS